MEYFFCVHGAHLLNPLFRQESFTGVAAVRNHMDMWMMSCLMESRIPYQILW